MRALVSKTGGYCAVTCNRCEENAQTCLEAPLPQGMLGESLCFSCVPIADDGPADPLLPVRCAGGARCADIVASGGCYDAAPAGYCQATCGVCSGAGLPCTDKLFSSRRGRRGQGCSCRTASRAPRTHFDGLSFSR
jgi:hypothetical protein